MSTSFWPTATNCNPTTCELCGAKLEKPKAKAPLLSKALKLYDHHHTQWRIDCACGATFLWRAWIDQGNLVSRYVRTHRTMELLMARSEVTGDLLVPDLI